MLPSVGGEVGWRGSEVSRFGYPPSLPLVRAPLLSICGRLLKLHLHHPAGHCCFQLPLGVGTVWWETRAIAQGSPRGMLAGLH